MSKKRSVMKKVKIKKGTTAETQQESSAKLDGSTHGASRASDARASGSERRARKRRQPPIRRHANRQRRRAHVGRVHQLQRAPVVGEAVDAHVTARLLARVELEPLRSAHAQQRPGAGVGVKGGERQRQRRLIVVQLQAVRGLKQKKTRAGRGAGRE